jgi:thiol-disulfide isomerase/thioredoxin
MNLHAEPKDLPPPALVAQRRRLLYAGVAVAAGVCGGALAWWKYAAPGGVEGVDPALWQSSFDTPTGATLQMQRFQGKPLVLNFWATWCPPCVEEMPLLDRFYRENSAKGWQVVGLAIDRPEAVQRFLREFPLGFSIALAQAKGSELGQRLGNLSGGLPFTLVVAADGSLVQRKIGRLSPADLAAWSRIEG